MSVNVDLGIARIETTIAINQTQVDEAIQALMSNSRNHKRLIGLDTMSMQTRTTLATTSSLAVLQLCDDSQCLIVRLAYFYHGLPQSLYNFLSLPDFTFVGFGIKDAMASLRQEFGFVCKNEAGPSESYSLQDPSVINVVKTMHTPQNHCISDTWYDIGNLTEDLIKLAVSNAHFVVIVLSIVQQIVCQ